MAIKLVQGSILNPIQVAAEVNKALRENTLVIVTKNGNAVNASSPVYAIYATNGRLEGGQIVET